MRKGSHLAIASLLIAVSTCLGIALTSTSAIPAVAIAKPEPPTSLVARSDYQRATGAGGLMVLGTAVVGANIVVNRKARRSAARRAS